MNTSDRFDRNVSDWLHADAEHRVPQHLDAVLRRTRTERQRPAWSSLERWLPVHTTLRLAPAPRLAWALAIVILMLAIVAAGLLVASRQRLPAPFGPARNGAIVSSHDGDIYAIDAMTHDARVIVGGDPFDFAPTFSRDGTKMLFLRSLGTPATDPRLVLSIANVDGTGVRGLTPSLIGLDWFDWSPDGKQIAFISRTTGSGPGLINIANVDGSGLKTLDVGRPAHFVSWLPPEGREIVFRGEQLSASDPAPGIFAVHPDGTGLRELSTRPPTGKFDFQSPAVSPDGSRVSYTGADAIGRVHVLDLGTGLDHVLPQPAEATDQVGVANFSPDGRSIVYVRFYADKTYQLVVAAADGSGTGTPLGPRPSLPSGDVNYVFTPDGSAVVVDYDVEKAARLLPVDGTAGSVFGTGTFAFADVQRLAP